MRISDWSSDVCSSDLAAILVDHGAMFLAAIMEKTLEPFDRLEADDVIVQHRGDEPLVMRERNEQAGRRPGDMQEQADAVPHPLRAQPFAERQEVVILHPDDVFFLDQRMEAVREMLVDAFLAAAELIDRKSVG